MVGDISYGETFKYLYNNHQLQNAGLTLTILVLFVIVINIAFANLLVSCIFQYFTYLNTYSNTLNLYLISTKVGLAVGDINEVRQNADISLIQKDLKFITQVKNYPLPNWMREFIYKPTLVVRNHSTASIKEKVSNAIFHINKMSRLYKSN